MSSIVDQARSVGDKLDGAADTWRRVKAILIGSTGNLIEWYDVYVFAAFQLYFAPSFFAEVSPERQQLFASVVFALGFFARPSAASSSARWPTGMVARAR
jgi:MFS transporter, MHS family, alpha-ketoglutarate permease